MEVAIEENPMSSNRIWGEKFPTNAAQEITRNLFTQSEWEKIAKLMRELKAKNPTLLAQVQAEKNRELEKHSKSITYKVFKEIEKISADVLDLLGLIKIKSECFPESYGFLAEMWHNFENVEGKDRKVQRKYKKEEIKLCAKKALAELEKLVNQLNNKSEKTSATPGTAEQKQTEEKSSTATGDNFNQAKEGQSEEQQKPGSPEPGKSNSENGNSPSSPTDNENSQNQELKKLKTNAIAEINQACQEAKITDQDLTETNRQWKSLLENSNDPSYINNAKEKLLAVIQQLKKEKENNNKLTELVAKGEQTNDPTELKKIIAEIERFRGEKVYTAAKDKINALKKKLADQDIEGYCNANKEIVEKELGDEGIKENELDTAIQAKLAKLKQGGIKQAEIDTIKDEVSDSIKLKKVEKELESLLKDCQENLSSTKKKELLKKLLAFAENNNSFYQQVYQKRKEEIEKLRSQLAKNSNSLHQSPVAKDNFPLSAKIIIGVFLLTAVVTITIKLNKQKQKKIKRR